MAKEYFDVVVIVPLEEELHVVNKFLPTIAERSTSETFMAEVSLGCSTVRGLLVQQEIEGRTHAHKAVVDVLKLYDVGLLICVGIAGCLTDDLKLGDVVYTGSVSDLLDNARASDVEGQLDLDFSPVGYETPREITNSINLLRTSEAMKPLHEDWARKSGEEAVSLIGAPFCGRNDKQETIGRPRSKNGKIACGDVSKSAKYNKRIAGVDRKFLAIETESGGVFAAAKQHRLPALTIRGLSDHADAQKTKLEEATGGNIRLIAASNAATFLLLQMSNPCFLERLCIEKAARTNVDFTICEDASLPLDDVRTIISDAQSVVTERLKELSLEFKHRDKGYRLPVPRVRKIADVAALEQSHEEKEVEIIEAINASRAMLLTIPRSYPDTSLAWMIADYVLTSSVDEEQMVPVVIDCGRLRSTAKGFEEISERDLLGRCIRTQGVKPIIILENPGLQSSGKLKLLLDEAKKYLEYNLVVICREDANTVAQGDLRVRIGADKYVLCGVSFAERGGSVCLHRLAAWTSGSPLVDHAAARSGCPKYTWSGVRPPSAECGLTAL